MVDLPASISTTSECIETPVDDFLQHRLVVEALSDVIEESGGNIHARNESARATSGLCNVPLLPPETAATC